MPQKPDRPFVPHRTPTTPRPAITASEFRLSPPFVPGAERGVGEPVQAAESPLIATAATRSSVWLRPIEEFLDTSHPAGLEYPRETRDDSYGSEFEDDPNELPPVEHFIDDLPAVDHFAPDNELARPGNGAALIGEVVAGSSRKADPPESGWLETEWQHFDWRAAAALGETANVEASSAWATTDWGGTVPKVGDLRQTAAHAIAKALDEIAKRIRDGDLAVPGQGPMADPATIAATLSALLGVKR